MNPQQLSAKLYDFLLRTFFQERTTKKALIQAAHFSATEYVLDFGCGTGTLILMVKGVYPSIAISGIDISSEMISLAEKKMLKANLKVPLVIYKEMPLPIPDSSLDKIVATYVFHHLSSIEKPAVLKELLRVLKHEGKFYLMDFGKPKNFYSKISFSLIRILDGFEKTKTNVMGKIGQLLLNTGWRKVHEVKQMNTSFGTVYIWEATK